MVLHFNFTKAATRASIAEQIEAQLSPAQISAVDATVEKAGVPAYHHHDIGEVNETIDALDVPERVRNDMRAIYDILAHAEAQVHGCELAHTHFHEVGNGSSIRNTLRICLLVSTLNPKRITATAVQTGSGQIECEHGVMAVPAPATVAIIATGIPTCVKLRDGELCTPTSAAIIKHFVQEFDA